MRAERMLAMTHQVKRSRIVTITSLLLVSSLATSTAADESSGPLQWPREYSGETGKLVLYQPQVTSWDDFSRLEARMALAFAPTGSDAPSLGTVGITADTDTNMEDHLVRVFNIRITDGRFPTLDGAGSGRLMKQVASVLPDETVVALERVVANLERDGARIQAGALNTDPPVIFLSMTRGILVLLDGKPVMSPIEGSDLKYAVNTNWDLLELDGIHYLLDEGAWIKAASLGGPWTPAGKLPKSFKKLPKKDSNWTTVRENLPGRKISAAEVPVVYVSEAPAELILIDRRPQLTVVDGTRLLWVHNTESDLFLSGAENRYYYLVSGRWFRADDLDGPWTFATDDLPEEFARIPSDHPRAHVRASIPGTPEAEEAVLLARIPQKATVKRDAARPDVTYSGDPQFEPVEGTSLHYAVNTPNDVIRIGDLYYVCFQAVWFVSARPTGPWEVADKIPGEIYSIPPSSPVYHVTHVHVYDSTPDYVIVGYTPGYWGVYVGHGCVWYGTGWYYPPYTYWGVYPYPVYYSYPYSFGVSAYYDPHTGTYGRGVYGYGPYGGWGYGARYNPTTGTYGRGAAAWGPYEAGGWAGAYNPRTGTSAGTYQRATPYAQWGESVVRRGDDWVHTGHYSDSRGTVGGIETSRGGRGVGFAGDSGKGFVAKDANNNLYAGKDGNVYRYEDGGWSRHEDGGWQPTDRPDSDRRTNADGSRRAEGDPRTSADGSRRADPTRDRATRSAHDQLDRDRRARDRGATRSRQSMSARSGAGARPNRGSVGSRAGRGGARGRRR